MTATCRECKLEVASRAALVAHWQEQRDQDKRHYHCSICMELFRTPEAEHRHQKEFHAAKQNLHCPGCNERFVAVQGLIDHIERNRCKTIGNSDFAAHREKKLAFARELQRRHYGEDPFLSDNVSVASLSLAENTTSRFGPYNFTEYLSSAKKVAGDNSSLSALRPKAENTVRPDPVTFATKETEFPQLGSKLADLKVGSGDGSGKTTAAGPWGQKKNLFPDAPPAVRPSRETQEALQQPAETKEQTKGPAWPPHDPRRPGWDSAEYYVPYTRKYKCPHNRCAKSFSNAGGLRTHLLSPQHTGALRVQCPRCCKWFDSMAAITAHAESQGVRCNLRETNGYRQFLDQLTAGLVDTAGKNDDGTEKYEVPDEARLRFGTSQGRWAAEQRERELREQHGQDWGWEKKQDW